MFISSAAFIWSFLNFIVIFDKNSNKGNFFFQDSIVLRSSKQFHFKGTVKLKKLW